MMKFNYKICRHQRACCNKQSQDTSDCTQHFYYHHLYFLTNAEIQTLQRTSKNRQKHPKHQKISKIITITKLWSLFHCHTLLPWWKFIFYEILSEHNGSIKTNINEQSAETKITQMHKLLKTLMFPYESFCGTNRVRQTVRIYPNETIKYS